MFHVEHPNFLAYPPKQPKQTSFQNKFTLMFHVEHLICQEPKGDRGFHKNLWLTCFIGCLVFKFSFFEGRVTIWNIFKRNNRRLLVIGCCKTGMILMFHVEHHNIQTQPKQSKRYSTRNGFEQMFHVEHPNI